MSYTPKNNFNLQLKRTGAGEVGFRKKLLKDVVCCNKTDYQFYPSFNDEYLSIGRSKTIRITGGCADFSWSVSGSDFTLANATTSDRENIISAGFEASIGTHETVTVTDSCGNSIEFSVFLCGAFSEYSDTDNISVGVLWACGNDQQDQIAITGLVTNRNFVLVDDEERINVHHCGNNFSLIITKSAILKGTGKNDHGQLGLGDTTDREDFTTIDENLWRRVSGGDKAALALRRDGSLYGTGQNFYGELGLGDENERTSFALIVSAMDKISLCHSHSLIITTAGVMYGAGKNINGELGLNNISNRDTFVSLGSGWAEVATGSAHSAALKTNGDLYTTGYNYHGSLGTGDNVSKKVFTHVLSGVAKIDVGGSVSTYAIKSDGTLWVTGGNDIGQLGLGDTTNRNSFIQVGSDTDWERIKAGSNFAMALKTNGALYGTGLNENGRLGLGDNDNRDEFTLISDFTCKSLFVGTAFTFVVRAV